MAQGALLANYGDLQFVQEGIYCLQSFTPYHLFHYLIAACYKLLGPDWVSRGVLTLAFGLHVGSTVFCLRSFGADEKVAAFAIPLFFGFAYRFGFGGNLFGLPFFFFGLAFVQRWLTKPESNIRSGLALSFCLFITWLIHPIPFYLCLGCGGLYLLCVQWRDWRRLLQGVLWFTLPFLVAMGYLWFLADAAKGVKKLAPPSQELWSRIEFIPYHMFGISKESYVESALAIALLVVMFLWAFAVLIAERKQEISIHSETFWRGLGLLSISTLPITLYLLVPFQLMGAFYVYQRLLQPAILGLLLLMRPIRYRMGRALYFLGWGITMTFLLQNLSNHLIWNQETKGLRELLPQVPKKTRLLYLVPSWGDHSTRLNSLGYLPAWNQVYKGGETRFSFSMHRRMPMADCNPRAQKFTMRLAYMPERFHPFIHGTHAKHLIIHLSKDMKMNRRVYPWLFHKIKTYKAMVQKHRWLLLERLPKPVGIPTTSRPAKR